MLTLSKPYAFFVILFSAFFLQGILYPLGSIVSQSIAFLYILCGLFCLMKYIIAPNIIRLRFISALAVFYVLILITFVISPKTVNTHNWSVSTLDQFKNTSFFCLSLFIGYIIGLKKQISSKQFFWTYILLLVVCILRFYFRIILMTTEFDVDSDKVTNNEAYNFVSLLLFVPLIYQKYKIPTIIAVVISVVFIFSGAKRGAILCTSLLFVYVIYYFFKRGKLSPKYLILSIFAVVIFLLYFQYSLESNQYLQYRFERTLEGDTSGRDNLVNTLWSIYSDFDLSEQVIGMGSAQSIHYAGNYAHNDWMELLIDNGILGVIIYCFFFFASFRYNNRWSNDNYRLSFNIFIFFLLCKSLLSMGYSSAFLGISLLTVGVISGNNERLRKLKYKHILS